MIRWIAENTGTFLKAGWTKNDTVGILSRFLMTSIELQIDSGAGSIAVKWYPRPYPQNCRPINYKKKLSIYSHSWFAFSLFVIDCFYFKVVGIFGDERHLSAGELFLLNRLQWAIGNVYVGPIAFRMKQPLCFLSKSSQSSALNAFYLKLKREMSPFLFTSII